MPEGARAALLREHRAEGRLEILDPDLEARFWALCDRPPRLIEPPDEVDWTPFWRQPATEEEKSLRPPAKSDRGA